MPDIAPSLPRLSASAMRTHKPAPPRQSAAYFEPSPPQRRDLATDTLQSPRAPLSVLSSPSSPRLQSPATHAADRAQPIVPPAPTSTQSPTAYAPAHHANRGRSVPAPP